MVVENSFSHVLQRRLHKPVAFAILPLLALANTAILIPASIFGQLTTRNSYGIIVGLLVGKPLGIFLFATIGAAFGLCSIPAEIRKQHLLWTGFLAGVGFTMSIFITLLAFDDSTLVFASKIAIITGSLLSGIIGYLALRFVLKRRD